jgi:hypothetical protein
MIVAALSSARGRPWQRSRRLVALVVAATWLAPGLAQENGRDGISDTEGRVIEEVVVRGERWRERKPEKPDPDWRTVEPRAPKALHRGRMSFGYDPAEDRELVRANSAFSLDSVGREPATLFRFRF